jgi:hypothetical protein
MTEQEGTGELRKQRNGICHRCGWKGPVSKVSRHDRKQLNTGRSFGRLCSDCIEDLLKHQSATTANQASRKPKLRAVRHRDVA